MNEREYLLQCETVCRNIFNALDALEMSEPATLEEFQAFYDHVSFHVGRYQDALHQVENEPSSLDK